MVHSQNKSPITFPLARVTGCYSSAILCLTFLPTFANSRGLPRCMAPSSVSLSLCWRVPSSCSRSDANIQVSLSMFSALVSFLFLTETGTVPWLLCAQLKKNYFSRSAWAPILVQGSRRSIFYCQGWAVPRLVCMVGCCTVQCPLGHDTFRQGLGKEPLLAAVPHARCLEAFQEEDVTLQNPQPADDFPK